MLSRIMLASAAVLLLTACQQKPVPVATPPAPPPVQKNYTVLFDTGKAALSPESVATIATAANVFKSSGGRSVAVTGHTDTTGTPQFNLQLSKQRAAAVQAELQKNGVPAPAIAALGVGEQNLPVKTAQNVPDQRNRSVDIVVTERPAEVLLSDTDYCRKLSVLYRRYRTNQIDQDAAEAMSKCETPDAGSAIPVLERAVTDMKIALPARMVPRT
ncbi:OmpA family protein [Reyranella sp.]|uniref:OmpA family protein n=1 Tax=Reyranella sp. TaxID=1929291 RepID=UPI003D0FACD3